MKRSEVINFFEKMLLDARSYEGPSGYDASYCAHFILNKLEGYGFRPTEEGFVNRKVCDYQDEKQ